MKRAKMIVVAILLVAMAVIVLQNPNHVQVDMLLWQVKPPATVLLLVTFLVGAVCGLLLASRLVRRGK